VVRKGKTLYGAINEEQARYFRTTISFSRQKLLDGKGRVSGRVVMVQDPLLMEKFWAHRTTNLSHAFQTLETKLPVESDK
jgi:hypothetical protein